MQRRERALFAPGRKAERRLCRLRAELKPLLTEYTGIQVPTYHVNPFATGRLAEALAHSCPEMVMVVISFGWQPTPDGAPRALMLLDKLEAQPVNLWI